MSYLGSWKIDDYITFYCNTHRADTGAATDADAVPTWRIYEDETGVAIANGNMALLDAVNTTGFYSERLQLLAATGFEKGKQYVVYISATVNTVTGTTHHTFQIEAEVDANTVSPTVSANMTAISGDVVAANNLETACDGGAYNIGGGAVVALSVSGSVGSVGAGGIAAASFAAGAIDAAAMAADAITSSELAASAANEIADAVWDMARAGHAIPATFGEGISSVQGNVTGSVGSVTGNVGGNVIGSVASVTGNVGGNVTGSVGSVAAGGITAASIAADAITNSELATSACQEIADQVLSRAVSNVEATADSASLAALILACFESAIAGAVWTIYRTDHATVFATRTVTTDAAADPIVEVT